IILVKRQLYLEFTHKIQIDFGIDLHLSILHSILPVQSDIQLSLKQEIVLIAREEAEFYQFMLMGLDGIRNIKTIECRCCICDGTQKLIGQQRDIAIVNIDMLIQLIEIIGKSVIVYKLWIKLGPLFSQNVLLGLLRVVAVIDFGYLFFDESRQDVF